MSDQIGTLNATTMTVTGNLTANTVTNFTLQTTGVMVQGTLINTTSGLTADFTSIASNVRTIILLLNGVSVNAAAKLAVQIGPAAGIETTNYSYSHYDSGGASGNGSTASHIPLQLSNMLAATTAIGEIRLNLIDAATNTWIFTTKITELNGSTHTFTSGVKALAGGLTRLRLTTVAGTKAFDAGSINIQYM